MTLFEHLLLEMNAKWEYIADSRFDTQQRSTLKSTTIHHDSFLLLQVHPVCRWKTDTNNALLPTESPLYFGSEFGDLENLQKGTDQ